MDHEITNVQVIASRSDAPPSTLDSLLNIFSQPPPQQQSISAAGPSPTPAANTTIPGTFKMTRPSALLSRLDSFLPQIHAANATLDEQIRTGALAKEDVDIEVVNDDVPHITMVNTNRSFLFIFI